MFKSSEINKKAVIVFTTLVCILPVIFSIVVYPSLPEKVSIHWNLYGEPDNFAPKAVAAFGIPAFMALINLITVTVLLNDPKQENQAPAFRRLAIWLIPAMSVVIVPVSLCIAMGADISIPTVCMLLLGVMFIIIGNYLPKSRQNYTIGLRMPWTLNDADNWNKTHRLAGFLFTGGGVAVIAGNFLFSDAVNQFIVTIAVVTLLAVIPFIYSYSLYRRQGR